MKSVFSPLLVVAVVATTLSIGATNTTSAATSGRTYQIQVGGTLGVPADAEAVALNLTVTDATEAGHVTAYPCGATQPTTSNLNYVPGPPTSKSASRRTRYRRQGLHLHLHRHQTDRRRHRRVSGRQLDPTRRPQPHHGHPPRWHDDQRRRHDPDTAPRWPCPPTPSRRYVRDPRERRSCCTQLHRHRRRCRRTHHRFPVRRHPTEDVERQLCPRAADHQLCDRRTRHRWQGLHLRSHLHQPHRRRQRRIPGRQLDPTRWPQPHHGYPPRWHHDQRRRHHPDSVERWPHPPTPDWSAPPESPATPSPWP